MPFVNLHEQLKALLAILSSKEPQQDPKKSTKGKKKKVKEAMKKVKRKADVLKKVMELRLAKSA